MKLWRDNKIAGEWERSEEDIARGFHASPWAGHLWPLDRRLRAYLTANETEGGLQSVWVDQAAYARLVELVEDGDEADDEEPEYTDEDRLWDLQLQRGQARREVETGDPRDYT